MLVSGNKQGCKPRNKKNASFRRRFMFENALRRMKTQRILREKTSKQFSNYVCHICVTVKFHHFKSLSLSELLLELSYLERERGNCPVFLSTLKRPIKEILRH